MAGCRREILCRLFKSRLARCGLLLCFVVVNVCLYYTGYKSRVVDEQNGDTFHKNGAKNNGHHAVSVNNNAADNETGRTLRDEISAFVSRQEIHIVIPFANVERNGDLQKKFRVCVESILKHTTVFLIFHVVGDKNSLVIADRTLNESYFTTDAHGVPEEHYRVVHEDIVGLSQRLKAVVSAMQKRFSSKPGSYYSHTLFFISLALHKVLTESIDRVIMLDADLKFRADIKDLFTYFSDFKETQLIGIAAEMQPVYRHTFQGYRARHPGTPVGEPLPKGKPGFNSGVLLLDLKKIRQSHVYNRFLQSHVIEALTQKYMFKGHLGDQDFFTLVAMENGELFYRLPCSWNYQLCEWWKDKGYQDVFDQYHNCSAPAKVYHGNCATPIPDD